MVYIRHVFTFSSWFIKHNFSPIMTVFCCFFIGLAPWDVAVCLILKWKRASNKIKGTPQKINVNKSGCKVTGSSKWVHCLSYLFYAVSHALGSVLVYRQPNSIKPKLWNAENCQGVLKQNQHKISSGCTLYPTVKILCHYMCYIFGYWRLLLCALLWIRGTKLNMTHKRTIYCSGHMVFYDAVPKAEIVFRVKWNFIMWKGETLSHSSGPSPCYIKIMAERTDQTFQNNFGWMI
jgi:hypothetical protein